MVSMANPQHGEIYNVADDDPTNREAVIRYVKDELLGSNGTSSLDYGFRNGAIQG